VARILGLFPSSLVAARGGMSANAYYKELRQLGIAARRSEVLQLFKISKSIVAGSPDEPFRNIYEVPSGSDLLTWPSRKSTGVAQTVSLTYRDMTTGQINQTWWRTVTPNGITREEALATAIDAYSEHAESYNQELIGAVHTSAYQMTPL
jgi:hypothetical protein